MVMFVSKTRNSYSEVTIQYITFEFSYGDSSGSTGSTALSQRAKIPDFLYKYCVGELVFCKLHFLVVKVSLTMGHMSVYVLKLSENSISLLVL